MALAGSTSAECCQGQRIHSRSSSRRRRHCTVGVARPVRHCWLRRPDGGIGVAHRLRDRRGLRLAGVMAVVRRGGLDSDGGDQRGAENGEGCSHSVSPMTTLQLWRMSGVVVTADMAMRPAGYHRRRHSRWGEQFFERRLNIRQSYPAAPMDLTAAIRLNGTNSSF